MKDYTAQDCSLRLRSENNLYLPERSRSQRVLSENNLYLPERSCSQRANAAIGGSGRHSGQGKGGALFIVTAALQAQTGGQPIPSVRSLKLPPTFAENVATHGRDRPTDNPNVYGTIQVN